MMLKRRVKRRCHEPWALWAERGYGGVEAPTAEAASIKDA